MTGLPRNLSLIGAVVLGLSALGAQAQQVTEIDGWQSYKFGMTPDEARAVPRLDWGKLDHSTFALDANAAALPAMTSITTIKRAGHSFAIELSFDQDKLENVTLRTTNEDTIPFRRRSECVERFEDLLRDFEHRYGPFIPFQSAHPTERVGAMDQSIEWRTLSDSASQYQLAREEFAGTIAAEADARTKWGPPGVQLHMSWSRGSASQGRSCELEIRYRSSKLSDHG